MTAIRLMLPALLLIGVPGFAPATAAQTAAPASPVTLANLVQVERVARAADGTETVTLEAPKVVVPGDKLLFTLTAENRGQLPATNFVITNPMPGAVAFESLGVDPDGVVSIDGGKTWGALATMFIKGADGVDRAATPADVTHVRWVLSSVPAGQKAVRSFRGIVK